MSKEKQIEEMALDLYELSGTFDENYIAERLYKMGYRKQSEGEWVTVGEELKNTTCSVCGHWVETPYGKTPYCPNCGAKMKGV